MGATKKKSLKKLAKEYGVQDFTVYVCDTWLNKGSDYHTQTLNLFRLMTPSARKAFLLDLLHSKYAHITENRITQDDMWQIALLDFLIGTLRISRH